MRRALESGDETTAAALEAGTSKRGQLIRSLREAIAEERYGEAAELASELRVETSRRADITREVRARCVALARGLTDQSKC